MTIPRLATLVLVLICLPVPRVVADEVDVPTWTPDLIMQYRVINDTAVSADGSRVGPGLG